MYSRSASSLRFSSSAAYRWPSSLPVLQCNLDTMCRYVFLLTPCCGTPGQRGTRQDDGRDDDSALTRKLRRHSRKAGDPRSNPSAHGARRPTAAPSSGWGYPGCSARASGGCASPCRHPGPDHTGHRGADCGADASSNVAIGLFGLRYSRCRRPPASQRLSC